MAASVKPTDYIAGYTFSSSNLVIPRASLSTLTAGECDPTTGDIRRILLTLLDTLVAAQATLTGSGTNTATMQLNRTTSGVSQTYSVQFTATSITLTLGSP